MVEVCRKMGVIEQSFYGWKRKYAGIGVAELSRQKGLGKEKRKLKELVADLALDKHLLQEVPRKKFKTGAEARGKTTTGSPPNPRWPENPELAPGAKFGGRAKKAPCY